MIDSLVLIVRSLPYTLDIGILVMKWSLQLPREQYTIKYKMSLKNELFGQMCAEGRNSIHFLHTIKGCPGASSGVATTEMYSSYTNLWGPSVPFAWARQYHVIIFPKYCRQGQSGGDTKIQRFQQQQRQLNSNVPNDPSINQRCVCTNSNDNHRAQFAQHESFSQQSSAPPMSSTLHAFRYPQFVFGYRERGHSNNYSNINK